MSIQCPLCNKTKQNKAALLDHIESAHKDDIPKDMSVAQYAYSLIHGRAYGLCRVCGKPTPWNEKAGKPYQLCGNPACKKHQALIAKANMKKVYGKEHLLNDPEYQEKLLANRSISGKYKWSDGKHEFVYTGSYEKFALEWLDKIFDMNPDEIQMPGPIVMYEFNGEEKPWITDMYLPNYNLVIEYKDGSFDKNTHQGFSHNRELEAAKDQYMTRQKQYNYVKVTNKNMMSLIEALNTIRLNNIFNPEKKEQSKTEKPVVLINESGETKPWNPLRTILSFNRFIQDKKNEKDVIEFKIKDIAFRYNELGEILALIDEAEERLKIKLISLHDSLYEVVDDRKIIPDKLYQLNYQMFGSVYKVFSKFEYQVLVQNQTHCILLKEYDSYVIIVNCMLNKKCALIYIYNKISDTDEKDAEKLSMLSNTEITKEENQLISEGVSPFGSLSTDAKDLGNTFTGSVIGDPIASDDIRHEKPTYLRSEPGIPTSGEDVTNINVADRQFWEQPMLNTEESDSLYSPRQELQRGNVTSLAAGTGPAGIVTELPEDIAPIYTSGFDNDSTQSSLAVSTGSNTQGIYKANFESAETIYNKSLLIEDDDKDDE